MLPPSPNISPVTPQSPKCLLWPPSGVCCPGAASWSHNHTNAPGQPGNGFAPTNPTNSGRPTSPTGISPMAPGAEILNLLDDHLRLAIASYARPTIAGPDVTDIFTAAFTQWGTPAAV